MLAAPCRSHPSSPRPSIAPSTPAPTELVALAHRIHAHPELRFEEHKASAWLGRVRRRARPRGRARRRRACRRRSAPAPGSGAGRASPSSPSTTRSPGSATRAGTTSSRRARSARSSPPPRSRRRVGGEVVLLGTPAEEGGGGKIKLLEAGVFDGRRRRDDVPPVRSRPARAPRARVRSGSRSSSSGEPSHAAIAPHDGRSALTACLDTFRLVDGQRVHFRDGVRVHGFVTNGGQAVNIIPERAACEFSVRALDGAELARVRDIVERCARAAAMASDVEVEIAACARATATWSTT